MACGVLVSSVILLVFALGFLFITLFVAAGLHQYKSLYSEVVCTQSKTTPSFSNAGQLKFSMKVEIACTNPNPYDIVVRPLGVGRALLGEQRLPLGAVTFAEAVIPASTWKDGPSTGVISMAVGAELSFYQALKFRNVLLKHAFTVLFNAKLAVSVEPAVLGVTVASVRFDVEQFCGLQLRLLPEQTVGKAVCSHESFDALDVPPLGRESAGGTRGFGVKAPAEMLQEYTRKLHTLGGAALCVGAACSLLCWCVLLRRHAGCAVRLVAEALGCGRRARIVGQRGQGGLLGAPPQSSGGSGGGRGTNVEMAAL